MKKYIVIVSIFILSLSIVFYYLFRNSEITKTTKEFTNIQQFSYKLKILSKKQTEIIDSLNKNINYDQIAQIDDDFNNEFDKYNKIIEQINDEKLNRIILKLKKKNNNLISVHEDIKTDTAVIKNSFFWLSKNYKTYLNTHKNSNLNKEFLLYLFNVIESQNNNIIIDVKSINSDFFKKNRLDLHLNIIYKKQISLLELRNQLQENNLIADIDSVILHTQQIIHNLNKETDSIIKSFVISFIFLLLFSLIIYIKEVISRRETQKLKNELQQFVDALNQSAIVSKADLNGNITYVNDKFCEISGYSKEELIGQPHNIIRDPDIPRDLFKNLWETIQDKKIFKGTIKNRSKNGDEYFVDSIILPILDINGDLKEYLGVRYNVTELIHTRDKAIHAEKAKDEFLSNMSHELRTPLNSIKGFSSVLKRLIKDEKQLKYLQNILDSSDNLIGLINDILDLSKLQSGKFSLDYHDFNLFNKTKQFLERFETQLVNSELKLNRNFNDNIEIVLHGDWLRISQIITNLLSNAIKFSPKNSTIDFNLKYENEKLIMCVEDRGIGMSKEAQEKIFKPFEQADSSTTREYGGTGLGLSIILNLIEQMKGEIKLSSIEGQGSTFEVIIPLKKVYKQDSKVKSEILENQDEKELLSGNILIAEDNKTNQMLIKILMQEFGLDCKIANDGIEAVSMFGKEKFDLVLMDENMPNLNGSEAMLRIHSLYGKEVPIVALTANSMSGDKEKFLNLGMDGYISKPIDDDELYTLIKKLLKN